MKKLALFLTGVILSASVFCQLTTFDTPVKYNDFIVNEQLLIGKSIKAFTDAFDTVSDTAILHNKRREIIAQADKSYKELLKAKPYEGDTSLIKHAKALFQFYSRIAAKEYKQVLDILYDKNKTDEERSKAFAAVLESVTESEKTFDTNFITAQEAFAKKYNIDLQENDFKIKD